MDEELKPEDLVEDPAFRAWIYHGTADTAWKEWISEYPDRAQIAELARNILLSVRGELHTVPLAEVKDRVGSILSSLDDSIKPLSYTPGKTSVPPAMTAWRRIASVVILATGLGMAVYLWNARMGTESETAYIQQEETEVTEVSNVDSPQKLVNLPDGSSVLLMPASSVSFPKQFAADKREVRLTGEAFFEVRKDERHPFFVYAGEMVTRVVGTSFTIKAYRNDELVSVRVKTGKVSVSAIAADESQAQKPSRSSEIILTSNQQAVLTRSDLNIAVLAPEERLSPETFPIENQSFEFRRTALSEVLETIKSNYNADIRYDSALLKNCSITASLGDEPLTEKLNMICEVIGGSYRIEKEVIIVEATGCL